MTIPPTDDEINEVLNECDEHINDGTSKFPGMSYEDGIKAGIEWVKGWTDGTNPMQ